MLILGKTTYFGVMPDWNPAEIIGIRPKPLDLSTKELIPIMYGQKIENFLDIECTSSHLMTTFGVPFVDLGLILTLGYRISLKQVKN